MTTGEMMSEQWTEVEISAMLKDGEASAQPPFAFNQIAVEGLEQFDDLDELPAPPRKDILEVDRELLELAARALGAEFREVDGEGYGNLHFEDGSVVYGWNPLQFSGDTFELGVSLDICIMPRNAKSFSLGWQAVEAEGDDPLAATRRAAARVAAEIGKRSNI